MEEQDYTKRFKNNYKKVRKQLDKIYQESDTLTENFGDEICQEITEYLTDNNYNVDRKMVEEAIQWCYICKMQ